MKFPPVPTTESEAHRLAGSPHFKLIEEAIWHIHQNLENAAVDLSLSAIARKFRVSEFYFQRIFKRWAGITPDQYVRFLKLQAAKPKVRTRSNLSSASDRSGLSSPSRLHDLFVKIEAVTPLQYKRMGQGMEIFYGFHPTIFGECLIGVSDRGVCFLNFLADDSKTVALENQKANWKNARFKSDPGRTAKVLKQIFVGSRDEKKPLTLLLKGTNFQIKVWEALLKIDSAETSSYKKIASAVGQPESSRAVGNACAHNDLAFIIPCHRVLTSTGGLGGYRWGEKRKLAILDWEKIHFA